MVTLDEKMIRQLDCILTPEEIAAHADEAARIYLELESHEEHEKAVKSGLKEKRERLEAKLGEHMQRVRTKRERRDVRCREVLLAAEKVVEVVREDTGEIVSRRPAKESELQAPIDFRPRAVATAGGREVVEAVFDELKSPRGKAEMARAMDAGRAPGEPRTTVTLHTNGDVDTLYDSDATRDPFPSEGS